MQIWLLLSKLQTEFSLTVFKLDPVLMQRINIEGIKNDPWFQKDYVAVGHREDEEVNLDDIQAVFDDIEVCSYSIISLPIRFSVCHLFLSIPMKEEIILILPILIQEMQSVYSRK